MYQRTITRLWLLFIALSCTSLAYGQYNLVRNPGFELYSNCNILNARIENSNHWYSATTGLGSPAYFNICCTNAYNGVPLNTSGYSYQQTKSGNAYAGEFFMTGTSNYRDYLQTKLSDTLKAGHCYYIEFFVNLVNNAIYAVNNIGLLVSSTPIKATGSQVIVASPQILNYGNPVIKDTLNWVKVAGVYTATGGEQYITIGNFKDDLHTDTMHVPSVFHNYDAGYYIDDVSVIPIDSMPLPANAGRDTSIYIGDSVFIGTRLAGLTNTQWLNSSGAVIASNVPGLYVKPTASNYYILQQNLCGSNSSDTVYVTVQPLLPLKLLGFTATAREGMVQLQWQTANEVNVSHFNVQYSSNGRDFYTIPLLGGMAVIPAKNGLVNDYAEVSSIPPSGGGGAYYRIECVDKDGRTMYSKVVALSSKPSAFSVYPNPTSGRITVTIPAAGKGSTVGITDIYGKQLFERIAAKGEGTVTADIKGTAGVYLVSVTNTATGKRMVTKVVLEK